MKQHRTLRGTLTSRIKNTIFAAFGENQLPTINMNASMIEIQSWKRSDKVKKYYTVNSFYSKFQYNEFYNITNLQCETDF